MLKVSETTLEIIIFDIVREFWIDEEIFNALVEIEILIPAHFVLN